MDTIVQVSEGKLSGKLCTTSDDEKQFFAFKGIPYAKPPVGELRFAAPEPPESWEGVRDATRNCNICAQFNKETLQVIGHEDCLYLNVYTPCLPHSNTPLLPVMVFFHGGGFVFGNGTEDSVHGPDYLIEKNVVIVSFNYRLGVLGFLSLDCKEAPGNMGLKDQVLALKWVQQNIKNFNGDPNNVTIFGISAGGASVEYLLLSQMSKGLFHKAISQSGSSLLPWAQTNKIKELSEMIPSIRKEVVTGKEDLLKYLKNMPINDLIQTSMMVLTASKWKGGIYFGFVPSIEKQGDWEPFYTKSTYDLLAQGEFHKVPFLSGFCSQEGLLITAYTDIFNKIMRERNFVQFLPFQLNDNEKEDYETKFMKNYLEGENECKDEIAFAVDFFTDLDFLGGIYVAASLIAKHNSPVYIYEFSYDGNLNYLKKKYKIDKEGACHGDDGGYLVKSDLLKGNLSDTDKLVRNRMCQMWTNFARHGDPTPKIDNVITTTWEPVTENRLACLVIDDKLTMKYDIYTERTKLFEELYKKYYTA